MFFVPPMFVRASAQITIDETAQVDDSNLSSYTFSIDGGAAQADRRIFVPFHWSEGSSHRTVSSVTINGVTASVRSRGHNGGATGLGAGLANAIVPSGSGAMDVVINMSGQCAGMGMTSIIATGLTNSSETDADTDETSGTATNVDVNVDVAQAGLVIAVYTGSTGAGAKAVTWTGATEIYDHNFNEFGGVGGRISLAVSSGLDAESSRYILAAITSESDAGNDLVVETWA